MARIDWVDGIGYCASLLVFCSFYMKTMIPLRGVAIASNIAFMTYGLAGGVYPVFVLHVVLFPLILVRRDDHPPVRPEHAPDFSERLKMVVDEVDHVDQEDDVEDPGAERQCHRVGAGQPRLSRQRRAGDQLLAKRAEHGRREIDAAVGVARADERQRNASRADADLEEARARTGTDTVQDGVAHLLGDAVGQRSGRIVERRRPIEIHTRHVSLRSLPETGFRTHLVYHAAGVVERAAVVKTRPGWQNRAAKRKR
jgi:hypothetical protein